MNHSQVFIANDLDHARRCLAALYGLGFDRHTVSLITGPEVPLDSLPDDAADASLTEFEGGATRGALGGGVSGLLVGLVAMAIPTMGFTLAGAALTAGAGVALGAFGGALAGSAEPAPFLDSLKNELDAGRVLVVVHAEGERLNAAGPPLRALGARPSEPFKPLVSN